jgi:hypothetical protein
VIEKSVGISAAILCRHYLADIAIVAVPGIRPDCSHIPPEVLRPDFDGTAIDRSISAERLVIVVRSNQWGE